MSKEDFLADKRTQQAVVMSLVIIGEAAARIMDKTTANLVTTAELSRSELVRDLDLARIGGRRGADAQIVTGYRVGSAGHHT